jgi:hypothetical protein
MLELPVFELRQIEPQTFKDEAARMRIVNPVNHQHRNFDCRYRATRKPCGAVISQTLVGGFPIFENRLARILAPVDRSNRRAV